MEKKLWFNIYSDYRSGTKIDVYIKPPEDIDDEYNAPEESIEITFILPEKDYRIYLVNEFPSYDTKPIWFMDLNKNEDYEKFYKKMFSQIHDCMPFEVSGYNSAYKEEGTYPEIPKDIKIMEEIEICKDIKENKDHVYFLCVLDCDGNELFTKLLTPIF